MPSIDVFIQGRGLGDILVATAEPHHAIREVIAVIDHPGVRGDDLLIFVEDMVAPIDIDAIVEEFLPVDIENATVVHPLRLHVSCCRHIEVVVRFNGEEAARRFSPGATIARAHHWAARRAFHMAPRDAAEHVLQLQGSSDRPDRDIHIGTLTSGDTCCVAFDLVPRKRVEG